MENSKINESKAEKILGKTTETASGNSESSSTGAQSPGVGINSSGGSTTQPQPTRRMPHLHKLEKKHSSGDLHSRLKTRKLLGVGETDDGDVHRSKLSQILGHSDQLYVRLPPGLRIWHIFLATVFSAIAVWAFMFPAHLFDSTFNTDEGQNLRLPVRLYGTALICLSMIFWNTLNTVDKDIIRLVLLSSVIFFTLQTIVITVATLGQGFFTKAWFITQGSQTLLVVISYFYYWAIGGRLVSLMVMTRSNSTRDLRDYKDKDQ
ncbi:tumor protein p53-inducible protein 11-like isoform X1 [Argopecten irradians]|uniref:tumor protein p53-inducible protein 11-like isoform X1 n=1 Tax=Argopecten irradians TaxID=31199 RepID=UPI00371E565B